MEQSQMVLHIDGPIDDATSHEILVRIQALLDAIAEDIAPGVPVRWRVVEEQAAPEEERHADQC